MKIKDKNIYLIGIGGISMKGVAQILFGWGNEVSGSDIQKSSSVAELKKKGIKVDIGHRESNISKDIDIVIKTDAIPADNEELKKAKKLNVPIWSRVEAINKMIEDRKLIAVCGTHGKSTTSAMISYILKEADLDPLCFLGADSKQLGGVVVEGEGDWAVVEACEYKQQFLNLHPDIIVITNIEEEHLDYYKDISEIKKTFLKFIANLKKEGQVLICSDSKQAMAVGKQYRNKFLTYGEGKNDDYRLINGDNLKVFGLHNRFNATAAVAAADLAGVKKRKGENIIEKFKGIKRRSEYLGRRKGVLVYDDYAHHPTEVKTTLRSFKREFNKKRIVLVFQPHQVSRLTAMFDKFVDSLKLADVVIAVEAYEPPGREEEKGKSSLDLVLALKEKGQKATYVKNYQKGETVLKRTAQAQDLVITMGAGPVNKVAESFLN